MGESRNCGREDQQRPLETKGDQQTPLYVSNPCTSRQLYDSLVSHHETVLSFDVDRDETSSTYWSVSYM